VNNEDLRRSFEALSEQRRPRGAGPVLARARASAAAGVGRRVRLVPAVAVGVGVLLVAGAAGALVASQNGGGGHRIDHQAATATTTTTTEAPGAPTTTAPQPVVSIPSKLVAASRLVPFNGCNDIVNYAKRNAVNLVQPTGLPIGVTALPSPSFPGAASGAATSGAGAAAGAAGSAGTPSGSTPVAAAPSVAATGADSYSTTNVQEPGVDEPDVVKNDGHRLFTLSQGRLWAIAVDGTPHILGSLPLEAQQLLLNGNQLIAIGATATASPYAPPTSHVFVVDVSKPAAMRVTGGLEMDSGYLSARLINGVARIVFSRTPQSLDMAYNYDPAAAASSLAHNKQVIQASKLGSWVPSVRLLGAGARPRTTARAISCAAAYHPPSFAGFTMLSVLTLDAADPQRSTTASVMASGDTVYASATKLYVASTQWGAIANGAALPPSETLVHEFDISDPTQARYLVSGRVPGSVLNQFAMSEDNGFLRVATTATDPNNNQSYVTVLRDNGQLLNQVGQVGGLGKDQRIYSVRFIGTKGYVVTFRQTDPLYVVDLSAPTKPRVAGALELLGFSAYLHPISDGLLLGVGQDATAEGMRTGAQVSLFDVSDPADPKVLQHQSLGERGSSAGDSPFAFDHHAFLYWAPSQLAVLPLAQTEAPYYVATGIKVARTSLSEVGRIHQPEDQYGSSPIIRRSLVVGPRLFTVSDSGVMANDLGTLAGLTWVPFG
jgi:uncharacterized secreted protein with C-terminal beta-propeller domain